MSQPLINHSPDLKRLQDEGYKLELRNGHLLVHCIPYVNSSSEIGEGVLVTDLNLSGNKTVKPKNHVIHFIGDQPCNKDGSVITAIQHNSTTRNLSNAIKVNRSFSNKPKPHGYKDYYQKITRYIEIISAPAISMDFSKTARVYEVIEVPVDESVFNYIDTNSTRAEIGVISEKLEGHKIGIIGLGGTGSYVLDQIAKTPVQEIHLFDGDRFLQHNAFRSPGAPSTKQLDRQYFKVGYFKMIYSKMHRGIKSHPKSLDESNLSMLEELDFVFLCIDMGSAKKVIIDYLISNKISFIDVGLDLILAGQSLLGTARSTLVTDQMTDHIPSRISLTDRDADEYASNIQIADLNALNAIMAVIKWKKYIQFYQDEEGEFSSFYSTNVNEMFNEDHKS
ncbi:MAG: ThiF family adenylyltransferase [Bacteroidota bacterium]